MSIVVIILGLSFQNFFLNFKLPYFLQSERMHTFKLNNIRLKKHSMIRIMNRVKIVQMYVCVANTMLVCANVT